MLAPNEIHRMEYLIGKKRNSYLSPQEEAELRRSIVKEDPSASELTLDDLVAIGLIMIGAYLLYNAIRNNNNNNYNNNK